MITAGYLIVAMWFTFVGGGVVSEIKKDLQDNAPGMTTVYEINIRPNGEPINICKEALP